MTHYIVSAIDPEDPTGLPVAELEVDAENERDAIEKAKQQFREQLRTLDGLVFEAMESKD